MEKIKSSNDYYCLISSIHQSKWENRKTRRKTSLYLPSFHHYGVCVCVVAKKQLRCKSLNSSILNIAARFNTFWLLWLGKVFRFSNFWLLPKASSVIHSPLFTAFAMASHTLSWKEFHLNLTPECRIYLLFIFRQSKMNMRKGEKQWKTEYNVRRCWHWNNSTTTPTGILKSLCDFCMTLSVKKRDTVERWRDERRDNKLFIKCNSDKTAEKARDTTIGRLRHSEEMNSRQKH